MNSMTGLGRATGQVAGHQIVIEVKSLNHRHLDFHLRSPFKYQALELEIQALLRTFVTRGKIDVIVTEDHLHGSTFFSPEAVQTAKIFLDQITTNLNLKSEVTLDHILSALPHCQNARTESKNLWDEFKIILTAAFTDLVKARKREGLELKKVLKDRFLELENIAKKIESQTKIINENLKERLKKRIQEQTLVEIDESRLAQEVVFYLDRSDVSEELDRLKSHFKLAHELLDQQESSGRKFDFLLQEFNREFNTTGSKTQDAEAAHLIIAAKTEIERIREQIQNVE